jgi:hypothetical protein
MKGDTDMSRVTNVILITSMPDAYANIIENINAQLSEIGHLPFKQITDTDSEKNLEAGIYVAAFNYLNVPSLVQIVSSTKWYRPSQVQLFIKSDTAVKFGDTKLD